MKLTGWMLALFWVGCATTSGTKKGEGLIPFGPVGLTEQEGKPKRFALVIGIDDFEDSRFSALKYAAADARAFANALADFDEINVLDKASHTSRAAILEALATLAQRARNPQDTVVVYFSSHGSLSRPPGGALERFLVTHDTRLDLVSQTGLAVEDILHAIETIPSRRKAVVLALCHSGKGKSLLADELATRLARQKGTVRPLEEVSEATVVLTACAFGETARESDELGQDIYTHFLLEALKTKADSDGDGAVTASEAHDYARERTYAFTGGAQRPTVEANILGRDPIVLAGRAQRRGNPVIYSYEPSAEGLTLFSDGIPKGAFPGGVTVTPGSHLLEVKSPHQKMPLFSKTVRLAPGERVALARLLPAPTEVSASLSTLGLLALSSTTRSEYVPPSAGIGLGLTLLHWPVEQTWSDVSLWWLSGSGTAAGFDERVPYGLRGAMASIGAGLLIPVGTTINLMPGIGVTAIWLGRELRTATYRADETAWGVGGSIRFGAQWKWSERLRLSATTQLGVLAAPLGQTRGPHPFSALHLEAGLLL